MSEHRFPHDVGMEALKTMPPLTILALTLNEWLAVASIIYIVVQLAYLIWRWRRQATDRKDDAGAG